MNTRNQPVNGGLSTLAWVASGLFAMGLLFARAVFPELFWLTVLLAVLLVGSLGLLIQQNQAALRSRTAAHGLNSLITTLLVVGIVAVLNFIVSKTPFKADLTKNRLHTLSDQTVKVVRGLQKTVKATAYVKLPEREKLRPLLDNYKALSSKFEIEYVDPDREPTRAKQAGIKKYGTIHLAVGGRDNKIDDATEEKLTNALIKLLKNKSPTLCVTTGHGEKNFNSNEAEGYEAVKKSLSSQSYEVKELNLMQEGQSGKIPDTCDAVAIVGPTKSFFDPEVKLVKEYLANGGRAIVALDVNVKGSGDFAPEISQLLEAWHVKATSALIVDPMSRMLGVDASVPILASFSKDNAITRDFQQVNCYFPLARPLEAVPSAPAGMNVQWLGQTTPKSWAVTNLRDLASGRVQFVEGKDKAGPLTTAMAVEGKQKDSKATKNTRLVVFGTSHFASNNYSRFGGNIDFFLNAASWVMEDESLISIRTKEETSGKVELSQKQGSFIFLLTVIATPLSIAAGGIGVWAARRRL